MKKKFITFSLCAVLLFGSLGLGACTKVETYHTIKATSSNATQGGTVSGYGNYKTNANVKLVATPKQEGSFLAWVKNEKVVSYNEEYTFVASQETEGTYTALFETETFEFGRLEQVDFQLNSFEIENYSATIADWSLKYNTISTMYQPLAQMQDKPLSINDSNYFDSIERIERVLYTNKKYYFSLTMSMQYTHVDTGKIETEPITTNFFINFQDIYGEDTTTSGNITTFEGPNYVLELKTASDGAHKQYIFTATVKNVFKKSDIWDNSNKNSNEQILSMSFVYKNPLN